MPSIHAFLSIPLELSRCFHKWIISYQNSHYWHFFPIIFDSCLCPSESKIWAQILNWPEHTNPSAWLDLWVHVILMRLHRYSIWFLKYYIILISFAKVMFHHYLFWNFIFLFFCIYFITAWYDLLWFKFMIIFFISRYAIEFVLSSIAHHIWRKLRLSQPDTILGCLSRNTLHSWPFSYICNLNMDIYIQIFLENTPKAYIHLCVNSFK